VRSPFTQVTINLRISAKALQLWVNPPALIVKLEKADTILTRLLTLTPPRSEARR